MSDATTARALVLEAPRRQRHGVGDMYGFIPVDRAPGLWLDGLAYLLATKAGDRDDVPPIHGVLTP